jgi:hypothetical protein
VIGTHLEAFGCLHNRHTGLFGKDLGENALACWVEVLDIDEPHSRVRGEVPEHLADGLQCPRRSANSNDRESAGRFITWKLFRGITIAHRRP